MTWTALQTLGGGVVSFRLKIERCPWEWVTHQSMVDTTAASTTNPSVRYAGLSVRSAKTKGISNPITGDLEVASTSVRIADIDRVATSIFGKRPTLRTYITAEVGTGDTTVNVLSTTGWPSSGQLWIDSECIAYSGVTATSFTSCTRGLLSSIAQTHYITTGGNARFPEVTNRPNTIAGARAYIYGYGEKDDPQGDGTLIWTGLVSRDPSFDGKSWALSIEPLTALLDRAVSADISEPVHPRGIYHPASRPFWMYVIVDGTFYDLKFPTAATDEGFWETNEDFCAYLTTQLQALLDSVAADVSMWALADGDRSWHLELLAGAAPKEVEISMNDPIEPSFPQWPSSSPDSETGYTPPGPGERRWWFPDPSASLPGAGSVPRGYWGVYPRRSGAPDEATAAAFPAGRIYVGGVYDFSGLSGALIKWPELGTWPKQEVEHVVAASDVANRTIDLLREAYTDLEGQPVGFTSAALPEIKLGRTFVSSGNLGDLLSALCTLTPAGVNAGSVPPMKTTDFVSLDVFPSVTARIVNSRRYSSFGEFSLLDMVKAECLLAGYALGLAPTGQIYFYELAPPIDSSLSAAGTIYEIEHPIVSEGLPTYERSSRGMCNQVLVRRGYSPAEDDYTEPPVIVRDVAAFGMSPRPRVVTISPKSQIAGDIERAAECVAVAGKLLGMFAMPYAMVRITCDARQMGVYPGDTVYVTSPHLPEVSTGTIGVESLPLLVIGREFEFSTCGVTLTCFVGERNACAYVPEFFISSEVNDTGNTWTLTLDVGAHLPSWYYAVGYRAKVWKYNATSAGVVVGTVSAVTSTTVTVVFDGSAAAIASGTWVLSWADVDDASLEAVQERNAYVASSTAILEANSGDTIPKEFG